MICVAQPTLILGQSNPTSITPIQHGSTYLTQTEPTELVDVGPKPNLFEVY